VQMSAVSRKKNMVCIIVDSKSPHRDLSNHIRYTTNWSLIHRDIPFRSNLHLYINIWCQSC